MSEAKSLKRKRGRPGGEEDLLSKITGKLHHGVKEVRKGAKKAKIFETQKIVKRLKGVRKGGPGSEEVSTLEAQLEILKKINHELVSDTALRTKLRKDKLLSQNSIITSAISSELSTGTLPVAPAGSPLAKVQGRLLSSKLIASEILTVVETLRGVLEPKPKDATLHESDLEDGSEESPPQKVPKTRTNDTTQAYGDMDDESVDDEDSEEVDDGGWESGSVHSAEEDERSLETSSDIETGDQSNTKPTNPRPAQIQRNQTSVGKDRMSGSATAGQSTFIPSLAVGYTRGDSDASDISDGEAETASGDLKKNRRGQRARRAIWEKKYGKNANHVKKDQQGAQKAVHQSGRHDKPQKDRYLRPSAHGKGEPTFTDTWAPPAQVERVRKEEKPIHPSWEAKKRLKEKQNPSILPSQGKKIVF